MYIAPTGPNHQSSLTQITNHHTRNSVITKILMYYESVDSRFHAALSSCRELTFDVLDI